MQKTIYFNETQVFTLPIEKVWTRLADTNELNKFIGLAPAAFTGFEQDNHKLVRRAQSTAAGFIDIAWTETVFEWVRKHHHVVERQYTKGPIDHVVWKVAVEEITAAETRVHLTGEFTVKGILGQLVLKTVIFPQLRKTFDYVETSPTEVVATKEKRKSIQVDEVRLQALSKKLRAQFSEEEMIAALIHSITSQTDAEVSSMQPYHWAELYGFDKRLTVEIFLTATQIGLLDQEWSLMCPNCRVPKGRTNSLKQLDKTVHCDLCGIDFDVDFDRYIEMRFSVNPSVRKAYQALYCINGPINSPHVLAQFRIPSHTTKEIHLPNWPQPLRWRVLKEQAIAEIDAGEQAAAATLTLTEEGFQQASVPNAETITMHNETAKEIVLVVEEVEWDRLALTAREATTYQLFRDLFATEVLSADQQMSVGQLTILFTDLKGSTKLYEAIGDAPAYSNVKKHFDYLMDHIRSKEGAIVKTIGDSVMAVFNTEANALKVAIAIQQNINTLNENLSQPVQIRIGFHTGPVIAVNANDLLDYFGHTVNLAARIQNESRGGDIVLTEKIYNELLKESTLASDLLHLPTESFAKQLAGLSKDTNLIRININDLY